MVTKQLEEERVYFNLDFQVVTAHRRRKLGPELEAETRKERFFLVHRFVFS